MLAIAITEITLAAAGLYFIWWSAKKLWTWADIKSKANEIKVVQQKVKVLSELEEQANKLPEMRKRVQEFSRH